MIPSVLASLGSDPAAMQALVFSAWKRVAGDVLARRTATIEFSESKLVIAVLDATWQRHLEDLAPQMLSRLNGKLGDGTVRRIDFHIDPTAVQQNAAPPPQESAEISVPGSLEEAASSIDDERLRENFLFAASACLARKERQEES